MIFSNKSGRFYSSPLLSALHHAHPTPNYHSSSTTELDHSPNNGTAAAATKLLQSCLTLCNPIDGSPPGSPVPGILQARTLEWVAISFSNA